MNAPEEAREELGLVEPRELRPLTRLTQVRWGDGQARRRGRPGTQGCVQSAAASWQARTASIHACLSLPLPPPQLTKLCLHGDFRRCPPSFSALGRLQDLHFSISRQFDDGGSLLGAGAYC